MKRSGVDREHAQSLAGKFGLYDCAENQTAMVELIMKKLRLKNSVTAE
jgi:hypothetical protein